MPWSDCFDQPTRSGHRQNTATAVNKPEDPPVQELLFKDPSLDKVLAGRQVQNGQVYFDGKQAYLNVSVLTLDDKEAVLVMPLNLQRMYHHEFTTDRNVSGYTMVKTPICGSLCTHRTNKLVFPSLRAAKRISRAGFHRS